MAYALGFSKDLTNLIYSMRDWKLEDVKRNGGTPSRLALKLFKIRNFKLDLEWLRQWYLFNGFTSLPFYRIYVLSTDLTNSKINILVSRRGFNCRLSSATFGLQCLSLIHI